MIKKDNNNAKSKSNINLDDTSKYSKDFFEKIMKKSEKKIGGARKVAIGLAVIFIIVIGAVVVSAWLG